MELLQTVATAKSCLPHQGLCLEVVVESFEKYLAEQKSLELNFYVIAWCISYVLETAEDENIQITQEQAIDFIRQVPGVSVGVYESVSEYVRSWLTLFAENQSQEKLAGVNNNGETEISEQAVELEQAVRIAEDFLAGRASQGQLIKAYNGFLKFYHVTYCTVLFDVDFVLRTARDEDIEMGRRDAFDLVIQMNQNMPFQLSEKIEDSKLFAFQEYFSDLYQIDG